MKKADLAYRREQGGFSLSLRQSGLNAEDFAGIADEASLAHEEMGKIEAGAIKNPDEGRQVTHFTDRTAYMGTELYADVEAFFKEVHANQITGSTGRPFDAIVVNGIGGSALGPQLVQYALNGPYWNELDRKTRRNGARVYFTDNTDSAGLKDILAAVDLETVLVVSISKSGGTRETRNNMFAIEAAYQAAGLNFARHAAAITMVGSKLDLHAADQQWLKVWPMAESIGGRTSETAIVGHVPAAAAGIDFGAMLTGAILMDEWTRAPQVLENPAYMLAASWCLLGNGKGDKNMVIVPYADRLVLLSRYFQQLVMESLGKELDLDGNRVEQGLTVFGNKGGTDAHAFIQQLNDGRNDFFVTFIEILKDAETYEAEEELTMGEYLHNFLQGLSNALAGKGRSVLQITFDELNAESLGMIIALYERAVAYYAELVHIYAFHQPGVEAYKKISGKVNDLARNVQAFIAGNAGFSGDAAAAADAMGCPDEAGETEGILAKYCVNGRVCGSNRLSRVLEDGRWRFTVSA